jgi:hypothetical protein
MNQNPISTEQPIFENRAINKKSIRLEKGAACLNCGTTVEGNFCPNCGQRPIGRINRKFIINEIVEKVLNLEGKFFTTIIDLTKKPGVVCRGYINGQRKRYFNPINFILISVALSIASMEVLGISFEDMTKEMGTGYLEEAEAQNFKMPKFLSNYQVLSYLQIAFGLPVFAWFFAKNYNFWEKSIIYL